MKKLFIITSLFLSGYALSQNNTNIRPCGEAVIRNDFLQNASQAEIEDYQRSRDELESFTEQFIQDNPDLLQPGSSQNRVISYTIPVVFHVIHTNGPGNISDEQIESAIEILNRDYQLQNVDAGNVASAFQGMPADIEIEFKIAKKNNLGQCTRGITRTYSVTTNDGSFGSGGAAQIDAVQNLHGNWPGNKYLNIYVVSDAGGNGGYTTYPSGTGMNNGIWILQDYVGDIGTSTVYRSRILTHEVGHWLNLAHLWGSSNEPALASNCSIDDGVADTPETIGWQSCSLNGITCDGNIDNVENYMEYSYCSKMFTPGQKARMHAALNSSFGGRNNIVSNANLIATGVNSANVLCAADFRSSNVIICEGQSVDFIDQSYHEPTTWDWSFTGGSPVTSSTENPSITYNTAGTYPVSLSVSDGAATETKTKNAFVTVLSSTGSELPLSEGFEDVATLPTNMWFEESPTNSWAVTSDAAKWGTKSYKLDNFNSDAGAKHYLMSSTMDLSGSTPYYITFDYAYKEREASNNEYLRIYASNNCGDSWIVIKNIQGTQFGTGTQSTPFTPQASDWKRVEIDNLASIYQVENFRLRFEFSSDGGNNFFIDNINIATTPLSVAEETETFGLAIYPNPANSLLNINFTIENGHSVNYEVLDLAGRKVYDESLSNVTGNIVKQFDVTKYEKGMYLLKLTVDGASTIKRFMIQ